MSDVMIDLETMGLGPKAAIVSIGAVRFDKTQILDKFYCTVDLEDAVNCGLELDASTVLFWLNQSKEAQSALQSEFNLPLRVALISLNKFITASDTNHIWANGYKDFQWLESASRATDLELDWHYSRERDFRTFKAMHPTIQIEDESIAHRAIDDALWQARYIMEILK